MKHLFLPYELAIIAKEKGFNEPCFAGYDNHGYLKLAEVTFQSAIDGCCQAPLYQQIVDWLFEQHQIHVSSVSTSPYKLQWQVESMLVKYVYYTKDKAIEHAFKLIKN